MFDTRCYDLAAAFLDDEPDVGDHEIDALAQTIQDAIEEWLNGREADRKPPLR
jgi:hypothetical protein